ncbi:T9SS type A sorting domain-containing protein [uncultured Psychroserpens sp.]|uniref:T9SS type A sorting domain-containing protein n=1 Tax=uncultured Psychroserpens sp. TaxID=255436 RepID=UPI00260BC19E|nr:T9SS type A sorting domain-containing protein [uncultured Psychroserpens sp.]
MKKTTLLFAAILFSFAIHSQQTTSFETSEGFTLGNVNTQNGWSSTPIGADTFIENQIISDENSTDGTFCLKIVQETAFGGQASQIVGAFYDYTTAVSYTEATFSADMNIDTFDSTNTSDYIFGLVNLTDQVFITYIRFTYEGDIVVLADDGTGTGTVDLIDTNADWTPLTWFNVRMELDNNSIEFFIDNVSIFVGIVATTMTNIEQVRFAHDNYSGFAYVDNFRTNDEDLSVANFAANDFSHFYDTDVKTLNLDSPNNLLNSVEIFDVLGKRVMNTTLSENKVSIDVSSFKDGIYLARVLTDTGRKTLKFVKH